ncbi:hypothetical protein D3C78_1749080 [compost metagenome]
MAGWGLVPRATPSEFAKCKTAYPGAVPARLTEKGAYLRWPVPACVYAVRLSLPAEDGAVEHYWA